MVITIITKRMIIIIAILILVIISNSNERSNLSLKPPIKWALK